MYVENTVHFRPLNRPVFVCDRLLRVMRADRPLSYKKIVQFDPFVSAYFSMIVQFWLFLINWFWFDGRPHWVYFLFQGRPLQDVWTIKFSPQLEPQLVPKLTYERQLTPMTVHFSIKKRSIFRWPIFWAQNTRVQSLKHVTSYALFHHVIIFIEQVTLCSTNKTEVSLSTLKTRWILL